jgi:hypothetical protein
MFQPEPQPESGYTNGSSNGHSNGYANGGDTEPHVVDQFQTKDPYELELGDFNSFHFEDVGDGDDEVNLEITDLAGSFHKF